MSLKLPLFFAFTLGLSAAFADDDFDLPDDVQNTEVIRFVPIEATSTQEQGTQNSPTKNDAGTIQNDTGSVVEQDIPAAFKAHKIPDDLNRPLRVGVFTGVKELYLKYQGETVRVTPHGNKVKFEAGDNSTEDISREFNSEENGCIAVAQDKKALGKACYPGSILFRATNGKLDAINSVDVEDYLRGVVPYEIGKLDSSRIEALKAQAVAARNYVLSPRVKASKYYDVVDSVASQVYFGANTEKELAFLLEDAIL